MAVRAIVDQQAAVFWQIIEQALQFIEEQRQVVFDARRGNPLRDIDIHRAGVRVDIERFPEFQAKALDAIIVERVFLSRKQPDLFNFLNRTLRFGVETANRLDLVIEKIDAKRDRAAHWEQVEDRSTRAELAVLLYLRDRAVTIVDQFFAQCGHVDTIARLQTQGALVNELRGRNFLQQGTDRQDQDAAFGRRDRGKAANALGDDVLMGRKLVVGQGFEIGKAINLRRIGAEKTNFLFQLLGAGHIAADDDRQARMGCDLFAQEQAAATAV